MKINKIVGFAMTLVFATALTAPIPVTNGYTIPTIALVLQPNLAPL